MPLGLDVDTVHEKFLVQYTDDVPLAVFGKPRDSGALVRSLEQNLSALSLWCGKNGIKLTHTRHS